jgi:predicted transcriptional regulator
MEAISNNENTPALRAYSKAKLPTPQLASGVSELAATKVHLTDVDSLASKVDQSGNDIRPEAIERGKALLADPNWPNDTILEGLAEKLLGTEDFSA